MSQPALSKNLTEVSKAISDLAPTYFRFPTGGELSTIKTEFFRASRMPGVLGLVDGLSLSNESP